MKAMGNWADPSVVMQTCGRWFWGIAWATLCLGAGPLGAQQVPDAASPVDRQTPLRFVFAGKFSSPETQSRFQKLAAHLAAQLGRPFELEEQPPSRALVSFSTGQQHVDLSRVGDFDLRVPGAIRLEPAVVAVRYYAVGLQADALPMDWSQLAGHTVAYVRGVLAIKDRLPATAKEQPVSDRQACMAMVSKGRADLCILNLATGSDPKLQTKDPQLQTRLIGTVPLFMWVTPGQKEVAERLQSALSTLHSRNELAAIMGPLH